MIKRGTTNLSLKNKNKKLTAHYVKIGNAEIEFEDFKFTYYIFEDTTKLMSMLIEIGRIFITLELIYYLTRILCSLINLFRKYRNIENIFNGLCKDIIFIFFNNIDLILGYLL